MKRSHVYSRGLVATAVAAAATLYSVDVLAQEELGVQAVAQQEVVPQEGVTAADESEVSEPGDSAGPDAAEPETGLPFVQVRAIGEFGFLAPLSHTIQFSRSGTEFDYVAEGGQDVLLPVGRVSLELELDAAHTIIFLYQPLDIRSSVLLDRDVVVDEATFAAGTPLDLRYGFDFYRVSYLYDFYGDDPNAEVSIGASLQIRDAVIDFTSGDGLTRRTNRDVGPVPELKFRGRYVFESGLWLGGEVDGIWAPVKYFNGGTSDVEGAIIDLSLRAGYRFTPGLDMFINVRYLAGGAEGTSSDHTGPGDGFVSNWLHFMTVTLGAEIGFPQIL